MKTGDEIAVTMAGFNVCNAVIEEIDGDKATIFIPATRVVMGVARSLTDLNPEVDREFGGLEQSKNNDSVAIDEQNANVSNAPKNASGDDVGNGMRTASLDSSAID